MITNSPTGYSRDSMIYDTYVYAYTLSLVECTGIYLYGYSYCRKYIHKEVTHIMAWVSNLQVAIDKLKEMLKSTPSSYYIEPLCNLYVHVSWTRQHACKIIWVQSDVKMLDSSILNIWYHVAIHIIWESIFVFTDYIKNKTW